MHICVMTVGAMWLCVLFVSALFYEHGKDPSQTQKNLWLGLCGMAFLAVILFIDAVITARKAFFKTELTDEGISESFIRITQYMKWDEVRYIYITGQPFTSRKWICFSKTELTDKELRRVLSSHKSIAFPFGPEAMEYVSERCTVKIINK